MFGTRDMVLMGLFSLVFLVIELRDTYGDGGDVTDFMVIGVPLVLFYAGAAAVIGLMFYFFGCILTQGSFGGLIGYSIPVLVKYYLFYRLPS